MSCGRVSWVSRTGLCCSLLGLGLGCAGGGKKDNDKESIPCGSSRIASAKGAFFGIEASLPGGPHVLRVDEGSFQVDGAQATLEVSEPSALIAYEDDVGREVQLSLCSDASGEGYGEVERCLESDCETGELRVLPLTLHPASDEVPTGYALVAEYHDPSWPTGPTIDLAVGANFAVLARGADGLRFLGSDPDAAGDMVELAHLATSEDDFYNDVKLVGDRFLLVASQSRGLFSIDVADPSKPRVLSTDLPLPRPQGHNVFVLGDTAYLARAGPGGGVAVVDISEPSTPSLIEDHSIPDCDDVHDLYVSERSGERLAYVNCIDAGLVVFDLAARRVLARHAQSRSHSVSVVASASSAFVVFAAEAFASGVQVARFDGDGPLSLLGSWEHTSAASVHNISCGGTRCLVSAYQEGWFELDLAEPSAPVVSSHTGTWNGPGAGFLEGASGIESRDGRVFVADTERGLLVYEPSSP